MASTTLAVQHDAFTKFAVQHPLSDPQSRLLIPAPLRERGDDIVQLAQHFLERAAADFGRPELTFTRSQAEKLFEYDWPGNVRELKNVIERAVILAQSDSIEPADLQLVDSGPTSAPDATPIPTVLNLDQMERETIHKALRKHGFNISHAAKELGLTRASLYRRMEKHGL